MIRNTITVLLAFLSVNLSAQFEYASDNGFEGTGKIQVVPHPKHSIGMKSVPRSMNVDKGLVMNFEPSIEKAQSSDADFWVIETVRVTDEGKRQHFLSFGRPSANYSLRTKERPYYLPSEEFEVLTEVRVDSALMMEPTLQEIYLRSLLRYTLDGLKRSDTELTNYYKTAFYLDELTAYYFREQDLDKMFQLPGALQRAFPEARLIANEKREELIPSGIWKEEGCALFLINEVTIEGKRYALKQLFSLQKGMLYADLRALEAQDPALAGADDISPLRYKPADKEINEIKAGTWAGPKKKRQ